MALEYRKFYPVLNQQSPDGSLGIGAPDGGIVWAGVSGMFPVSVYTSAVMTVSEVAELYAERVKTETFAYIERYMPQWRMSRWRRYYDLRNKVIAGGGTLALNAVELAEYNCFPDPTETHEDCDVYVGPVLSWCSDCVVEHNRVFFGMLVATTIEQILSIKDSISYPEFIG